MAWTLPLGLGFGALGIGIGLATLGARVIIYADRGDGSAEFRRAAEWAAGALNTRYVYPSGAAEDFLGNIRRHPRIARFVWIGHGTTQGLFASGGLSIRGESDLAVLANELAPRLALGAIVGLAACNAGSDRGQATWDANAYEDGGAQSFAAGLRDGIARKAPWLVLGEVRAHTAPGHTTRNPAARAFPFREAGRAGRGANLVAKGIDPERWIVGA